MKKISLISLIKISIVAAIYVVTTMSLGEFGYGPIQFRISEILNFLAFLDPLYVIGLTLGCVISNLFQYGLVDVFVGGFATFLSTYLMYKSKNLFVSSLYPLLNGLFVGLELFILFKYPLIPTILSIAASEFVVMSIIGYPVFKWVFKNKPLTNILRINDKSKNITSEMLNFPGNIFKKN